MSRAVVALEWAVAIDVACPGTHSFTYPSLSLLAKCTPSGAIASDANPTLCSDRVAIGEAGLLSTFQSLIAPGVSPVASVFPSARNATALTEDLLDPITF